MIPASALCPSNSSKMIVISSIHGTGSQSFLSSERMDAGALPVPCWAVAIQPFRRFGRRQPLARRNVLPNHFAHRVGNHRTSLRLTGGLRLFRSSVAR